MMRPIALVLTVLTGFSGLVYEVTWQKYLATLLGSHSEAAAAVLGLFLGGLAAGYWLFGHVTRRMTAAAAARRRRPRLLAAYGLLEVGIGGFALLFPVLFAAVRALSLALPTGTGLASFSVDVLLAALLVLPPAVLMGGTIPMLTQALARSLEDATRFHALVYAFNTAGAFAGALAAGFWLIPALGLVGALMAVSALNLSVGGVFLWLDRRQPESAPPDAEGAAPRRLAFAEIRTFAAAALLCGFAMMSVQTVLMRLGGLSLGSSQFTFSMVVAVFVLCIAIGSLLVSAMSHIPRSLVVADLWAIPVILYLLYGSMDDAPYWTHVLRSLFANVRQAFYPFFAAAFLALLAAISLPVILSGAILPLFFDHLRGEFGELGDTAGRLYAWNTLGSLLGALLGGYALLLWMDLDDVFRLAIAALTVAAILVTARVSRASWWGAGVPGAVLLTLVALLPGWQPDRMAAGLFRSRTANKRTFLGPDAFFRSRPTHIAFYDDDPNSTVSVSEIPGQPGRLSISVNGKSDGAVPIDNPTMVMLGVLPAILADRPERAFVIGLGTGVSAGDLASLDTTQQVTVAEISRGVIEAWPRFDFANRAASKNPRIEIVQSDAYRALMRRDERYDMIISEPSNPWVTGVEMLYSREFLSAAKARLAPGGVFAQWMHTYEIDPLSVALVLDTYVTVFEHVTVWYGLGADLIVLGLVDPQTSLDLERIRSRLARPDVQRALRRIGIRDLPALLAHELLPVGVLHARSSIGPIHTLTRPRLSTAAARAFFAGGKGELPLTAGLEPARVGAHNSLLGRLLARAQGDAGERLWSSAVEETCRYRPEQCLALLAAWSLRQPQSPARDQVKEHIREMKVPSRTTDLRMIPRLAILYGAPPPEDTPPLAVARSASHRFERYYTHAVPFARRRLAELWRRCEEGADEPAACLAGRRDVETRLGDLDAPEPGRAAP